MSDQPPVPPTQPVPPGGGATWQGVQPVVERPTEVVPPVPPATPPPAPPVGGPGGGGSNRGVVIAIVVAVLAILGVGAFLLLGGDDDDDGDDVTFERDDEDDEETTTTTAEGTTTSATEVDETTTSTPETGTTVAAGGELAFTQVTDDSGQLVVEVPDTWTQVDGTPLGDGAPNVQASTDLAAFRQRAASGLSFTLLSQQNADPDTTLDFLTSEHVDDCEVQEREDYADGVFTGRLQVLSDCGGQGITLVVIVASNQAGQSVEVSTVIVPPDPLDEIEQRIIETFNVVS
jgi:hypothetical protein